MIGSQKEVSARADTMIVMALIFASTKAHTFFWPRIHSPEFFCKRSDEPPMKVP